jgi:hypothetical protein
MAQHPLPLVVTETQPARARALGTDRAAGHGAAQRALAEPEITREIVQDRDGVEFTRYV